MMFVINKWRWHYITFPIKRVNIMVYQNHRLENVDSMEKVDGHQDPPGSAKVQNFASIYKDLKEANLVEIVKVFSFFLCLASEEINEELFFEVGLVELKGVLTLFQNGKSSWLEEWTIEFFIAFFDSPGQDSLRVVEEFQKTGMVLPNFNSTFITLILKVDKPARFGEFRMISLCNCVYKIIAKILPKRLKGWLSTIISLEQFGFLTGRQIHDAEGVDVLVAAGGSFPPR
jgi:hypothetical protein